MAISLPERTTTAVGSLTPREIVAELDKYVIGQAKAKRAVAIALRNRLRRQRLAAEIADEVTPKNILMIGPTGVGKTEIARRLARLAHSPFIKVEASKFTEVGYVGRDVESMVRDLVELAVDMVRAEKGEEVREKARAAAEDRLLDLLLPPPRPPAPGEDPAVVREQSGRSRDRMREQLHDGRLDERVVEIDVQATADAVLRDHRRIVGGGDRRQPQGHDGQHVRGRSKTQAAESAGGLRAPRGRGAVEAGRHGIGQPHGRSARRAGRDHLRR